MADERGMWRTILLAAAVTATLVVGMARADPPAAGGPGPAVENPRTDPCTSAFYWEHRDCPLPALVALDDIQPVTGVDTIPPIDHPRFESIDAAASWLGEDSSLIVLSLDGQTRAYPLAVLVWHEIVNDRIGDVPVAVTYCPLCNSGIAFDRRVPTPGGSTETLDFGTSGHLFRSNLVMYDRQHENLWLQLNGTAVAGEPFGSRRTELQRLSTRLLGLAALRDLAPDASVLSRRTGVDRPYGRNPYPAYDRPDGRPRLYEEGPIDDRLPPMERVIGLDGPTPTAVTEQQVREHRILELDAGAGAVTLWWSPGQAAALDATRTQDGRDVGQVVAHQAGLPSVGSLTFRPTDDADVFTDEQTGSRWNLLGQAVDGPLAGEQLRPAAYDRTFWFSWFAFHPDTTLRGDTTS